MSSSTWSCPVCQRRVPMRVPECWCGFQRSDAERHAADERARRSPGAARELIGIVAVLLLGLAIYVLRLQPAERRHSAVQPAVVPATALAPQRPATAVSVPTLPPPTASQEPEAVPAPSAEPVSSQSEDEPVEAEAVPHPQVEDSTEGRRAAGQAALTEAYGRVAAEGRQLDEMLSVYQQACLGVHQVRVTNCEATQARLARSARDLIERLQAAEEEARRAWVRPGEIRELRQRLGMEAAEDAARRALAPQ